MRDSKQILKILFLCFLSTWFRATANRRVSTKFPNCLIDTFIVWLKMDKNGSLLGASNCEKQLLASSCLFVRLSHWTNFIKIGTWIFFKCVSGKFNFRVNLTRKTALWHQDLRIFIINSRSTFLTIKMSQRNVEKIKTHILWQKMFLQKIVLVKR